MLDEAFQQGTEAALADMAARPPAPKKQEPAFSLWGMVRGGAKAVPAGAAEGMASGVEVGQAIGERVPESMNNPLGRVPVLNMIMSTMQTGADAVQQKDEVFRESEVGRSLRNVAQDYMPDPVTAHGAEVATAEFMRLATKAVTAGMVAGPVPGAVIAGAEEGFTTADKLAEQGVDLQTRTKVGAVTGAVNAAGFALPVAGKTVGQTVGLALAGGPASFIAQQTATREILQNADYTQLADQYDPFDPVGLTLSTIVPLGFGAMAMRGAAKAKARASQEEVEAARVMLQNEHLAATNPNPPTDIQGANLHRTAVAQAIDQLADGQRVDVTDLVSPEAAQRITAEMQQRVRPTLYDVPAMDDVNIAKLSPEAQPRMRELYNKAAEEKPGFDAVISDIADEIGAFAKLADLKKPEKAVQKVMVDYQGDPSKIKDLLRATIEVDSVEAAQRAVASVFERFEVVKSGRRNLLDPGITPADGYRDAKFNVMVNGHVAEVQVNIPEMLAAKKNGGHKLYDERLKIEQASADRIRTDKEQAAIDRLNKKMRDLYEPAWAAALERTSSTSALKSAGEIGPPLRLAESGGNTRGGSVSQAALENGTPGTLPSDTGIPSTSRSSTPLGKVDGTATDFISSSKPSIGETPTNGKSTIPVESQALARAAEELERASPDLMVQLDGMDAPMPLSKLMAQLREEVAQDLSELPLIEAAANCFLRTGGV